VCSFGSQVVEKVENEEAQYENGRYVYRFENSPMCEYMIAFIQKLKQLPEKSLKNSVLENFSVLQVKKKKKKLYDFKFIYYKSNNLFALFLSSQSKKVTQMSYCSRWPTYSRYQRVNMARNMLFTVWSINKIFLN
jgi:hypothetical protein